MLQQLFPTMHTNLSQIGMKNVSRHIYSSYKKPSQYGIISVLSVFQIVKFKNEACPASSGETGVCFTEAECAAKGGVASGNCASAFGVCCVFTVSACGGTVTQNNTYIQSPNYPAAAPMGMCMYTLNKCDSDICQFRY